MGLGPRFSFVRHLVIKNLLSYLYLVSLTYYMRKVYRKDVELVPVNDIMLNDVTADISKKNDTWQIFLTIFLEVVQRKSNESQSIIVTTASTLHISQDKVISKTNEVVLHTNERYVNINVQLTVPTVSVSTFTEIKFLSNFAPFIRHSPLSGEFPSK